MCADDPEARPVDDDLGGRAGFTGHAGTDQDQVVAVSHPDTGSATPSAARICSIVGEPARPLGVR